MASARAGRRTLAPLLGVVVALAAGDPADAIIAGEPAERSEFPFFARLGSGCGGVLIAPDRVLSAGHCRSGVPLNTVVRIGPDSIRRRVALRAQHPIAVRALGNDPGEAPVSPDLLLLGLNRPVDGVAPLAMSPREGPFTVPGTEATTMGYGAALPNGSGGGEFRKATLEVQEEATCRRVLPTQAAARWSLCTRDPDGERPYTATCYGDSGGPLVAGLPAEPTLIGIVSFGVRCGSRGGPDNFAVSAPGFALDPDPVWAAAAPRPRIEGRARVGERVRCEVDWTVAPTSRLRFDWFLGRRHRASRRGPGLRLRPADAGGRLRCAASGKTPGGFGGSGESPAVVPR